jgi:hypothetical protein
MIGAILLLAAATIPLRNPFWPVGYRGTPEPIDDEPRVRVAADANAAAAEDDAKTSASVEAIAAAARDADDAQAMERRWIRARKSLRVGGLVMKTAGDENRQSIAINGLIYGDGDLVSVNHDGWRFTWRVKKLTENKTLQLVRVRARELEEETQGTKETKETKR